MKKNISLVLAVLLVISLFAFSSCGKKKNDETTTVAAETTTEENAVSGEDTTDTEIVTDEIGETAVVDVDATTAASAATTAAPVEKTTAEATTQAENNDYLKLVADSTTVAPGGKIKVYFVASDCDKFAYADITYIVKGSATIGKSGSTNEIGGMYVMDNKISDTSLKSGIMVATTAELSGEKISYIEIVADSSAKSGSTITVTTEITSFSVGLDVNGNNTKELAVNAPSIEITVK